MRLLPRPARGWLCLAAIEIKPISRKVVDRFTLFRDNIGAVYWLPRYGLSNMGDQFCQHLAWFGLFDKDSQVYIRVVQIGIRKGEAECPALPDPYQEPCPLLTKNRQPEVHGKGAIWSTPSPNFRYTPQFRRSWVFRRRM